MRFSLMGIPDQYQGFRGKIALRAGIPATPTSCYASSLDRQQLWATEGQREGSR